MMISKTIPLLPTGVELTEDEWDTMKRALYDSGLKEEYQITDYDKREALKIKLGIDEEYDKE